jgi:SAM-dependent methyltransferase
MTDAQDETTIAAYNAKADDYAQAFSNASNSKALARFMGQLPAGASVLDLGCGPGAHAAALHASGFQVTAMDASAAMVAKARAHKGITVRQAGFADLSEQAAYDGVWANFSLLHAARADFPGHLSRIATALKPGGLFHLGMKTGEGEHRDALGRFYTYYTLDELRSHLTAAGFEVIDQVEGKGKGLAGTVDPWVEMLARRP